MVDDDEYVKNAYKSRTAQFAELFKQYDKAWGDGVSDGPADEQDEADTALDQSILSVDKIRGFEVLISFGGPGEWLTCKVDEDGDLTRVEFFAAWWSTPIRTVVEEGDPLWRLAERFNPYQYGE